MKFEDQGHPSAIDNHVEATEDNVYHEFKQYWTILRIGKVKKKLGST